MKIHALLLWFLLWQKNGEGGLFSDSHMHISNAVYMLLGKPYNSDDNFHFFNYWSSGYLIQDPGTFSMESNVIMQVPMMQVCFANYM